MSLNQINSRIKLKRSNVPGQLPTVPASDDHTDGSWLETDIYYGELFLNTADDKLFTRTESGIIELNNSGGISLNELSVVQNAAGNASLVYNNVTGEFTYTPPDLTLSAHTHVSTEITDFDEAVDDRVNTLVQAGTGIDVTYNDANNELTLTSDHMDHAVTNNSGATITAGTPVYQTGVLGNNITIGVADADDPAKMPAIGVLKADVANGADGEIVLMGQIRSMDTSSFFAGDVLYVSTTGTLVATKPTSETSFIQNIGRVLKVHASNGVILVTGAGRANATSNLNNGNIFIGNASNQAETASLDTTTAGLGYIKDITAKSIHDLSDVESATGIANGNVLKWNAVAGQWQHSEEKESIQVAVSDETTALTTGTGKLTFRMPYAFTLTEVRCSVTAVPEGSNIEVDINEGGVSVLSTVLSIDAGESTSTTATTAAVISDSALADDAEITVDIDAVGSTVAGAGLKVTLIGYKA